MYCRLVGRNCHFSDVELGSFSSLTCHDRYSEAERMLAGNTIGKSSNCSDIEAEFGVKACYVFALLGLLYRCAFVYLPQ